MKGSAREGRPRGWRWLVVIAVCACLRAGVADAEPWSTVFAAGRDTTFFLCENGALVRGPFSLEGADTIWRSPPGQHVVRLLGSPHGGRLAWTARGLETDTTRLWIASPAGTELRLRYFSLQPKRHGQAYAEISWPTTADEAARGPRLHASTFRLQGPSSNAVAWTPQGDRVVVGYDGGIAAVAPGTRGVARLSGHRAVRMRSLHPSPVFWVDALDSGSVSSLPLTQFDLEHFTDSPMDVRDGRIVQPLERRSMLMRPEGTGFVECAAERWLRASIRTAGRTVLWWSEGREVAALRAADCSPAPGVRAPSRVDWLAYDTAGGRLLGLSGRALWCADEEGGEPRVVLQAMSGVRRVLRSEGSDAVALVTKDSVHVWSPASGEVRRLRHRGAMPDVLYEAGDRTLALVTHGGAGGTAGVARAPSGAGEFVPVRVPDSARWKSAIPGPRGEWILFATPGLRAPAQMEVFELSAGTWKVVDNPGLCGWEPCAR